MLRGLDKTLCAETEACSSYTEISPACLDGFGSMWNTVVRQINADADSAESINRRSCASPSLDLCYRGKLQNRCIEHFVPFVFLNLIYA